MNHRLTLISTAKISVIFNISWSIDVKMNGRADILYFFLLFSELREKKLLKKLYKKYIYKATVFKKGHITSKMQLEMLLNGFMYRFMIWKR